MKHLLLLLTLFIISCGTPAVEAKQAEQPKENTPKPVVKEHTENYAVVWKWITTDKSLVERNSEKISTELTDLWKQGVIENAYYDSNAKVDKFEQFPNITFVIKAKSANDASNILNDLTVVKEGISKYTLFPVGLKWLGRKPEAVKKNGITKSYVAVWKTTNVKKPSMELTQAQSETVIKLWNDGKIENAYFDIEGVNKANRKHDFVFYINTNSMEEAKALCESLPFSKEGIATYDVYSVGTFWLGEYKK